MFSKTEYFWLYCLINVLKSNTILKHKKWFNRKSQLFKKSYKLMFVKPVYGMQMHFSGLTYDLRSADLPRLKLLTRKAD